MTRFARWTLAAVLVLLSQARADDTLCVTLGAGGVLGNKDSTRLRPSRDGQVVAFSSTATNLLPGIVNAGHVFVRDLAAGTLELASVATSGAKGNAPSVCDGLSADGRFVVFESTAGNLVPGDILGLMDVFVRDRVLGTTQRASLGLGGAEPNSSCERGSISDDGRYVVFLSGATNLDPAATSDQAVEVFLRDMLTGQVSLVSKLPSGGQGYGNTPSISGNGRYVCFTSGMAGFVPGFQQSNSGIYRCDLVTGGFDAVSMNANGEPANQSCDVPAISSDGRFVVFTSPATNLLPGDVTNDTDVFLRDMQLGKLERVSVTPNGKPPNGGSLLVTQGRCLSDDGRFVSFASTASDLVPGVPNTSFKIFVRDRVAGTTLMASVPKFGGQADKICMQATLSEDGRRVFFDSKSTNLAGPDGNAASDGFVRLLDSQAWHAFGYALAGVAGLPVLSGLGALDAGSLDFVQLQQAAPSSLVLFCAGFVASPTPFKGGLLVPVPPLVSVAVATGPAGDVSLAFNWPPGFPAWTLLYLQAAIADAAAPHGVALSNLLLGVTP